MKTVRIALAQINTTVGDLSGNAKKILDSAAQACALGADIVVVPELAVTGYPPEDLLLRKHFIRDSRRCLSGIVRKIKGIVAVVGCVDCDAAGLLYNAAAVIYRGRILNVYRKNNLPNYGVFDEKRYFVNGSDFCILNYAGIRFGINICEDIWSKNDFCGLQAKKGAQVLLNLSASPYHRGKVAERKKVLVHCAKTHRVFVCYCNLIGGQDELVFDGASVILDPRGKIIAQGKAFHQDLVIADVSVAPSIRSAKKEVVVALPAEKLSVVDKPAISASRLPRICAEEEIYQALVLGTRDYLKKNGFQKAVIGLSGGIDSALVAAIACDAIGYKNVLGVSMPSPYSSQETQRDAKLLSKNLGIAFKEISITKIFKGYLKTLKPVFKKYKENVTEENLQARIRGNLLMALSNKFGHLVLTTGNKSEMAVGYCTLYGDMAGGFAVLKDVPKTTVYRLVNFVNKKSKNTAIPKSIIRRPPTAELRKNQRDQDSLPPYHVLDSILEAYIEKDQGLRALQHSQGGVILTRRIMQLVDAMEYKRRQAPIGVKITPKAFGRDRRIPLTNYYKES